MGGMKHAARGRQHGVRSCYVMECSHSWGRMGGKTAAMACGVWGAPPGCGLLQGGTRRELRHDHGAVCEVGYPEGHHQVDQLSVVHSMARSPRMHAELCAACDRYQVLSIKCIVWDATCRGTSGGVEGHRTGWACWGAGDLTCDSSPAAAMVRSWCRWCRLCRWGG